MFYGMHVLTIIIRGAGKKNWFLYEDLRYGICTKIYSHEEEVRGLHINIGNLEIDSNGRRGKHEPGIMRSL